MWDDLNKVNQRLVKLNEMASRVAMPKVASGRELVTILDQEVAIHEDDLSEQRVTFYNGDPDTYVIKRLGVTVSMIPGSAGVLAVHKRIFFAPVRHGWAFDGELSTSVPAFDFQWNYALNSTQSQYSRDNLTSKSLVGFERARMLDLKKPLIIKPSDSVEFRAKPTMFFFPGNANRNANNLYLIAFIALGYRSVP